MEVIVFYWIPFRPCMHLYSRRLIKLESQNHILMLSPRKPLRKLLKKSFLQVEADCPKAIDLDKNNVKVYLRRGIAREMLGYYKEAIEDFRYALVLEPTNKRATMFADRLKKLLQ